MRTSTTYSRYVLTSCIASRWHLATEFNVNCAMPDAIVFTKRGGTSGGKEISKKVVEQTETHYMYPRG